MKPCLKDRRVVEVNANQTWNYSLLHRVYSCPDKYENVLGATALMLTNAAGRRIPLNVEAVQVCDLRAPNFLQAVPEKFRIRLSSYKNGVQNIPGILDGNCNHFGCHRYLG